MKELDINSMKLNKIIIFWFTKKQPKKVHKNKKSPNKIENTHIILCFLFQCLTHAIVFFRSNSKYPPDFYLYDKFSSIISVIINNAIQYEINYCT